MRDLSRLKYHQSNLFYSLKVLTDSLTDHGLLVLELLQKLRISRLFNHILSLF